MLHTKYQNFGAFCFLAIIFLMFSVNNLLIKEKPGKLLVAQLKWNLSLKIKWDFDISMKSFITVHYETTRITF